MNNHIDKDLEFLYECSNENLQMLCDFIVKDDKGEKRLTETLSVTETYKTNYPHNMQALIPLIIEEIHDFGSNTLGNIGRRLGLTAIKGATYRNILEDVCDKLKVNYNKNNPTELLEQYLLHHILIMSIDKMTEEDVMHLSEKITKESLKGQIHLLKAGSPLYIRLITMIVANLAKKYGLKQASTLIAKFAGGRAFAVLTGPIGWALTAIWTLFDIAGPAYRVLVPVTITVAYMRNVKGMSEDELNEILK